MFFVTVACGILSGFHSTQTAIISRTVKSEKQGRMTFYNMMVLEGFIAMVWAAGAMGVYNLGLQAADATLATDTIGVVCRDILGNVGGIIALLGVIVLPITSGDTALRALRLTLSESLHLDQSTNGKRLGLAAPVFVLVAAIIVWAKMDTNASTPCGATSPGPTRPCLCSPLSVSLCGCLRAVSPSCVDAPDSGRLLHLYLLQLHCQCHHRLQPALGCRLSHRRGSDRRLCGGHRNLRQERAARAALNH